MMHSYSDFQPRTIPHVPRSGAAGFGLVELMVSMAIGLVLVAALVALFIGTSRNNREMASANSMIENGRFAIQLLENDVVHAGFWGTYVPAFDDATADGAPADEPALVPDPCEPYASWNAAYIDALIGIPAQAYDQAEVLAGPICGGVIEDMVPDSDVLVVRHADTCVPGVGSCDADTPGDLYIQGSLCTADALRYVLDRSDVVPDPFALTQIDCTTAAEKRRYVSNIYYVRDFAVVAGDGVPTLVRATFAQSADGTLEFQPPVPLVEGIDAFRVEFGFDTLSGTGGAIDYNSPTNWTNPLNKVMATNRGDGIPDGAFRRCDTATPCNEALLANTTAIRLYVLARSREPTQGYVDSKDYVLGLAPAVGPFDDAFKRHVYTTTVRLPNVSGRRERP